MQHLVKFNPGNVKEILSNGKDRVFFLSWENEQDQFEYYSPQVHKSAFSKKEKANAKFTQSVFIPNGTQAVTGTDHGDILVWDLSLIVDGIAQPNEKRLIKVVTLNQSNNPINILTIHNEFLVTGNNDGSIRFYDFHFKVCSWFENLNMNEIKSISFARMEPRLATELDEELNNVFKCADFLVADSSAMVCMLQSTLFEEIDPAKKKGDTIFHGLKSRINCIAVHPSKPILAIGGKMGFIITWNYLTKETIVNNFEFFDKEEPTTMAFTPDGQYLCIGNSIGTIRFIDPDTLEDLQECCRCSENKSKAIINLIIASDSKHLATMDVDRCVCLFKREREQNADENDPLKWIFSGKMRSHELEITSICFGESLDENEQMKLRLFSIGKDRRLFEYDVYKSDEQSGLIVVSTFKVEQEAKPTACIWDPKGDSKEDLIVTVNDDYKMKIWNVSTKGSRKTCLGPTYGGEIVNLKKLEIEGSADKYLFYSTKEKVIGLIKLALDGNPNKTMGLIAHPGKVVDICTTTDGKFLFTCGGDDLAVNMWSIDVSPIEQAIVMGGEGIEPFINLIEGGRDGQTYQDMKDFFYYSMIRSKDENTTKTRRLDGTVPLDELPNLMRAMGYYPTEQEVENMKDEVRFSNFTETGQYSNSIDLETFIRLFVNHRPVYGIGKNNIESAFEALTADDKKTGIMKGKYTILTIR
jgi:WD40 repeat protein